LNNVKLIRLQSEAR